MKEGYLLKAHPKEGIFSVTVRSFCCYLAFIDKSIAGLGMAETIFRVMVIRYNGVLH